MQQAGKYYRNGEFDNAIKIYEELKMMDMKEHHFISIWQIHITESDN